MGCERKILILSLCGMLLLVASCAPRRLRAAEEATSKALDEVYAHARHQGITEAEQSLREDLQMQGTLGYMRPYVPVRTPPNVTCVEDAVLLADRLGQAPSIGMVWELEPVCLEGAAEERWETVAAAIDGLLLRLPEESACQFFLIGDPSVEPELATFQAQGQVPGVVRAACEDRV